MPTKYNRLTKKIDYPPLFNKSGFDSVCLNEIASEKLLEIYSNQTKRERAAKYTEKYCYSLLDRVEEYSSNWFRLMIYLYKLELERDKEKIWIRYWQKLSCNYKEVKNKGSLDLDKLRETPIENLIDTPVRPSGSKLTSLCPFHNKTGEREKSQSFFIYPEDNSFHCFSCQVYGQGAIDFLMQKEDLDFKEAIYLLN